MRIKLIFFLVTGMILTGLVVRAGASYAMEEKVEISLDYSDVEIKQWLVKVENGTAEYDRVLGRILSGAESIDSGLMRLRDYYYLSEDYDPFSKKTIDKLTRYAYLADMSSDPQEVNDSLVKYRDLLYKNLPNLDVVDYAIKLSLVNVKYGDTAFLTEVRDVVKDICAVKFRRTGETPEQAYHIVTYGEETYILQTHDVKVIDSEIYEVGRKFYNVHNVESKDGEQYRLYFDVTAPIRNLGLKRAAAVKKRKIVFPLQ